MLACVHDIVRPCVYCEVNVCLHVFACVCMCAYVREERKRAREREGMEEEEQRGRMKEKEKKRMEKEREGGIRMKSKFTIYLLRRCSRRGEEI